MKVIVLGAGAGGGFPQWNAGSARNIRAFHSDPDCPAATQCSLAVSADGEHWTLLNASPDIRQQIIATPELHPRTAPRSSPITSVVLTGADVDALAGLLILRERHAFTVWCTDYVRAAIEANPIFGVLDTAIVSFRTISGDEPFTPAPGLTCRALPTPGKPPLWLEKSHGIAPTGDSAIGISVAAANGRRMAFVPSCADVTPALLEALDGADLLAFDGTMFSDDEMIMAGEGAKTARRMGHLAMSGDNGAIAALRRINVARRYFIHINNSNPALDRKSAQRRTLQDAGWEVAEDGMRFDL